MIFSTQSFIGTKNTPHLRNRYVYRNKQTNETQTVNYCRHGCPVTGGSLWRIGAGAATRLVTWMTGYDVSARSGEAVAPEYKDICKDKLDRGGNEAKNEDETSYYMMKKKPDDEWFEDTLYQLLGPPILVKKKEAIPKRLQPGLALSEFLRNMTEPQKEAMLNIDFLGWKIEEVQVSKRPDQDAFPTDKTAHTIQERCDQRWAKSFRTGFKS